MLTMLEVDFESLQFFEDFKEYKCKKIVLYGAGRLTGLLLSHPQITQWNIVGICDRDKQMTGKCIEGVPVISREEAERIGDLLVINTIRLYWDDIYNRISEWDIDIYYRNAVNARTSIVSSTPKTDKYRQEDLQKKIREYDIISFDFFDTLVTRQVELPEDMYKLVQNIVSKKPWKFDFYSLRKRAEALLHNPTYDEIYEKLAEMAGGLNQEIIEYLKEVEFNTERKMLVARRELVCFLNSILDSHVVCIVSDMYYSKEQMQILLHDAGIFLDDEQVVVSSEEGKTKSEGDLWEYIKSRYKGSILHIGDNEIADVENPRKVGIDSIKVPTTRDELAGFLGMKLHGKIDGLENSVVYGMIAKELCNSPFLSDKCNDLTPEMLGYNMIGPLLYGFFEWLLEKSKKEQLEKLFFLSRDGYLLIRLFHSFCQLMEAEAPQLVYLETSRQVVEVANIRTTEDIYSRKDESVNYFGSVWDYLESRFGIQAKDEQLKSIHYPSLTIEKEKILLEPYEKEILRVAEGTRKAYLKYLKQKGVDSKGAVVDLWMYGTTQYGINRLMKSDIKGFYICCCQDKYHQYDNDMVGYVDDSVARAQIFANCFCMESIFTSPLGTLCFLKEDGCKIYGKKSVNQIHFNVRYKIANGIIRFFEELSAIQKEYKLIMSKAYVFQVEIINSILNGNVRMNQELRDGVKFVDELRGVSDSSVFEDTTKK